MLKKDNSPIVFIAGVHPCLPPDQLHIEIGGVDFLLKERKCIGGQSPPGIRHLGDEGQLCPFFDCGKERAGRPPESKDSEVGDGACILIPDTKKDVEETSADAGVGKFPSLEEIAELGIALIKWQAGSNPAGESRAAVSEVAVRRGGA